ncbi:MAG: LysM peptidoglycan-binding domain-containing protein [Anaerolineae bacterium]
MSERQLSDAVNDCIDRLADGQSIDDCLVDYPEFADQLRSLLTIGQATRLNRANVTELSQMRGRLDPQIEALIQNTPFAPPSTRSFPWGMLALVAGLLLLGVVTTLFLSEGRPTILATHTATDTQTPTVTHTSTHTPTVTHTSTHTPTVTVTVTTTPTVIEIISTATRTTPDPTCVLPEGWFEYRIQTGDTLSEIAVNAGTEVDTLLRANCLGQSTVIIVGDTLYVPRLWQTETAPNDNTSTDTNNVPRSPTGDDNDDDDDDDDNDGDDDDD